MESTFFSSKFNKAAGSVALVGIIVALTSYAYYTLKQANYLYTGPTTISVTGEGEAVAMPDVATFNFSIVEKNADGKVAGNNVATKVNEMIDALKEAGVDEKDIKTDYYNMYPVYRYEERSCGMGWCPQDQIEDGFEVSQSMTVKVRDISKSGELVALVGEKGATNISGLVFEVDDEDALKDMARAEAIADAKAKAEMLAKELGVKIDKMVGYYEDEGYVTPYYGGMGGVAMAKAESADSVAANLPSGENKTTSRVTISYQIK
jgi:uncharacterized protein YggE